MESMFVFVFAFTIFLIVLSLIMLQTYSKTTKKSKMTSSKLLLLPPPGKTGWPLIGETLAYVSSPEKFIRDRMTKHSPEIFHTSIAGEKMAVLCGLLANKFIFTNEGKLFTPWLPRSLADALSLTSVDPSSPSSNLVDHELHKFLKQELIQNYVPIMDSKARQHLETHWVPYKEVKVHPLSKEFTFALACRLSINYHKPDQVREIAEPFFMLTEGIFSVPVNIPGTPFRRAMKGAEIVREKIAQVIRQRKSELLSQKEGHDVDHECQDMLGRVLMASRENGKSVNENEIAAKIVALLFAGFYTTSTTLTFVLYHLAEHPHVYDKVLREQMEITQSKGTGELLTWKDIQKMKYTWNVVLESMRLKPPGVGGFREAITDFTYAGYQVPKGWKVHWNVHSTNKDPKYFADPEKFDPSRFQENTLPPYTFVPFGAGPRVCAGKEYSRIAILVIVHNVVTRFKLTKANPNEKIIYTPDPVPVEGLRIRIQSHDT